MEPEIKEKIYKVLSRNDTGETNSHQSGISIPKNVIKKGIFPNLGIERLNPRVDAIMYDEENKMWQFQFIYYNDIHFGKSPKQGHDEFRLTCVKDYIRQNGLVSGDEIWFGIDDSGVRHIGFKKKDTEEQPLPGVVVIKLSNNWKSVSF